MRLTKFNPETGLYEYIEPAKTQEEFIAQRKAVIQKLGEYEDRAEGRWKGAGMGDYYCSLCCVQYSGADEYNYCPNCGAKMKGMSRDKQTEIANDLNMHCVSLSEQFCGEMSCNVCISNWLYNVGYRKSTEVAREIFEEIEKEIELALDSNYKVKRDAQDMNDGLVIYVEGKIDCLQGLLGYIAELKKKYTEGGE